MGSLGHQMSPLWPPAEFAVERAGAPERAGAAVPCAQAEPVYATTTVLLMHMGLFALGGK